MFLLFVCNSSKPYNKIIRFLVLAFYHILLIFFYEQLLSPLINPCPATQFVCLFIASNSLGICEIHVHMTWVCDYMFMQARLIVVINEGLHIFM